MSTLQDELETAREALTILREQLQEVEALQDQLDKTRGGASVLQDKLVAFQEATSQAHQELESARGILPELQEQLVMSTHRVSELQAQIVDEHGAALRLQAELEEAQQSVVEGRSRLAGEQATAAAMQAMLATVRMAVSGMQSELEQSQGVLPSLQQLAEDVREVVLELSEQLDQALLTVQAHHQMKEASGLQEQLPTVDEEPPSLQAELGQEHEAGDAPQQDLDDWRQTALVLRAQVDEARMLAAALTAELADARATAAALQAEHEQEAEATSELLRSAVQTGSGMHPELTDLWANHNRADLALDMCSEQIAIEETLARASEVPARILLELQALVQTAMELRCRQTAEMEKVEGLREDLGKLQHKNSVVLAELERERCQVSVLQAELEKEIASSSGLRLQLAVVQKENEQLMFELKNERDNSWLLQEQLDCSRQVAQELKQDLCTEQTDTARLSEVLKEAQDAVVTVGHELKEEVAIAADLRMQLGEARKERSRLQERLQFEQMALTGLGDAAAGLRLELETERTKTAGLRADLEAEEQMTLDLRGKLEKEQEVSSGLKAELEATIRLNSEQQMDLKREIANTSGMRAERFELDRELAVINELRRELSEGKSGLLFGLKWEQRELASLRSDLEMEAGAASALRLELDRERRVTAGIKAELEIERHSKFKLQAELDEERSSVTTLEKTVDSDLEGRLTAELEAAALLEGWFEREVAHLEEAREVTRALWEQVQQEKMMAGVLLAQLETERGAVVALGEELKDKHHTVEMLQEQVRVEAENLVSLKEEMERLHSESALLRLDKEARTDVELHHSVAGQFCSGSNVSYPSSSTFLPANRLSGFGQHRYSEEDPVSNGETSVVAGLEFAVRTIDDLISSIAIAVIQRNKCEVSHSMVREISMIMNATELIENIFVKLVAAVQRSTAAAAAAESGYVATAARAEVIATTAARCMDLLSQVILSREQYLLAAKLVSTVSSAATEANEAVVTIDRVAGHVDSTLTAVFREIRPLLARLAAAEAALKTCAGAAFELDRTLYSCVTAVNSGDDFVLGEHQIAMETAYERKRADESHIAMAFRECTLLLPPPGENAGKSGQVTTVMSLSMDGAVEVDGSAQIAAKSEPAVKDGCKLEDRAQISAALAAVEHEMEAVERCLLLQQHSALALSLKWDACEKTTAARLEAAITSAMNTEVFLRADLRAMLAVIERENATKNELCAALNKRLECAIEVAAENESNENLASQFLHQLEVLATALEKSSFATAGKMAVALRLRAHWQDVARRAEKAVVVTMQSAEQQQVAERAEFGRLEAEWAENLKLHDNIHYTVAAALGKAIHCAAGAEAAAEEATLLADTALRNLRKQLAAAENRVSVAVLESQRLEELLVEERALSRRIESILDHELRRQRAAAAAQDEAISLSLASAERLQAEFWQIRTALNIRSEAEARQRDASNEETLVALTQKKNWEAEAAALRQAVRREAESASQATAAADVAKREADTLQVKLKEAENAAARQGTELERAQRDARLAREEATCLAALADAMRDRSVDPPSYNALSTVSKKPAMVQGVTHRPISTSTAIKDHSSLPPFSSTQVSTKPAGAVDVSSGDPDPAPEVAKVSVSLEVAGCRFTGVTRVPVPGPVGSLSSGEGIGAAT